MSNVKKICDWCNTVYIGDGYKSSCTRGCYHKEAYVKQRGLKPKPKKNIYENICKTCKEPFITNRERQKNCSVGCTAAAHRPTQEDKIKHANQKWLEDKPKVNHARKSFARLNREAEWKRVWDDNSWNHHYQHIRG